MDYKSKYLRKPLELMRPTKRETAMRTEIVKYPVIVLKAIKSGRTLAELWVEKENTDKRS